MDLDKALTHSSRFLAFSGLAAIAFGIVVLVWPGLSLEALIALFGAFARVFEIMAAVNVHAGRSGAFWLGIGGLLSIVFGAVVAIWPISGALAILWLIGVYSIVFGVTRLVFAYRVHAVQGGVRRAIGRVEARS